MKITDLAVGTAAEHMVCADLLLSGARAFLADQNCAFDVACDVGGKIIRIQVKATRGPRAIPSIRSHVPAYMFFVRRAGKAGARLYGSDEFDLLALVAVDISRIAYMPPSLSPKTIHIRPPGHLGGKQFDDFGFDRALEAL